MRCASEVAAELLGEVAPRIATRVPSVLSDSSTSDAVRFGSALAHRIVAYVAALEPSHRGTSSAPARDSTGGSGAIAG